MTEYNMDKYTNAQHAAPQTFFHDKCHHNPNEPYRPIIVQSLQRLITSITLWENLQFLNMRIVTGFV